MIIHIFTFRNKLAKELDKEARKSGLHRKTEEFNFNKILNIVDEERHTLFFHPMQNWNDYNPESEKDFQVNFFLFPLKKFPNICFIFFFF